MATFPSVSKSNLSEQVARSIEQMILSQELKVGEKLPSEADQAEQFGTSRNVVREAMKTLKERGLVDIKNGSGAFVAQPDSQALGSVVNRLVAVGTASEYEVYEIRLALEVQGCGMAADHATADNIAELRRLIHEMETCYHDSKKWSDCDFRFHEAIAYATGNSLYPEFLRPLIHMVYDISDKRPRSEKARLGGIEQHKAIVDAIASHSSRAARGAMADHLREFLNDLNEEKTVQAES